MLTLKPIIGVYINYYFICKRKLWLFANDIKMEHTSDVVALGKLIDESSYGREKKHILIDNLINIDFMGMAGYINEIKKSNAIEDADIWQVKYYLYYLKKKGIPNMKGILNYPKLKRREIVELNDDDERRIEEIIKDIRKIISNESPPLAVRRKICSKCSYFELCFV